MQSQSPASDPLWTPEIWRNFVCVQQPTYLNKEEVEDQTSKLRAFPPLVHYTELDALKTELKLVEDGQRFFLIMGDCAERFQDCTGEIIASKVSLLLKAAKTLESSLNIPVLKFSRIAGQYAKPRSADYETIDGAQVISYRGDSVNDINKDNRQHDAKRILETYHRSAATLNYMRAILGQTGEKIYASHEGLLMEYESALTRNCEGKFYNQSGHFVWIGERTRALDQAHVKFFSGLENPIGVKVGGVKSEEEFLNLHRSLNPKNEKGKLVVITRCGVKKVAEVLSKLIEIKQKHKLNFVWVSDPMHGNTFTKNGYKTRDYSVLLEEILEVAQTLRKAGEKLGGIHLESTPDEVTECLGGKGVKVGEEDLPKAYTTFCDPRLNHNQVIDLLQEVGADIGKN